MTIEPNEIREMTGTAALSFFRQWIEAALPTKERASLPASVVFDCGPPLVAALFLYRDGQREPAYKLVGADVPAELIEAAQFFIETAGEQCLQHPESAKAIKFGVAAVQRGAARFLVEIDLDQGMVTLVCAPKGREPEDNLVLMTLAGQAAQA